MQGCGISNCAGAQGRKVGQPKETRGCVVNIGGAREKPRRPNFNTQEGESVKNGGARSGVG